MTFRTYAVTFLALLWLPAIVPAAHGAPFTEAGSTVEWTRQSIPLPSERRHQGPPDPSSEVDYWAPPAEESPIGPPEDPCLPPLYKDWQEFADDTRSKPDGNRFIGARITIDRTNFILTLQGIGKDGYHHDVYRTHVGLGDFNTPTPAGRFVINHLYCYPDVLFFVGDSQQIPSLYKGFLAPILRCDRAGHCRRYRELGMHGFDPSALPNLPKDARVISYGAVSNGCVRVPDPCKLKKELIRLVGIGSVRKNERGCYHWLKRPVEVAVEGNYPGTDDDEEPLTIVSIFEKGINHVQDGLNNIISVFGP